MCSVCNKEFGRKFVRDRHYNDIHIKKSNDNFMRNNDHSVNIDQFTINNEKHTNKKAHNNIIFDCVINPIINNYSHYDINDLSLFEQYLIFTYNISDNPNIYQTFMNLFNFNPNKPKYNNIKYTNIKSSNVHVYDGKAWIIETTDIFGYLLNTQRDIIRELFNKFRIFLSHLSIIYVIEQISDSVEKSTRYNSMKRQIKMHIYNNRSGKFKDISDQSNIINISLNHDHSIWESLSKSFDWNDVVFYINKLELIGVDFSRNLTVIKMYIHDYLELHPEENDIFHPLINHMELLICRYFNTN